MNPHPHCFIVGYRMGAKAIERRLLRNKDEICVSDKSTQLNKKKKKKKGKVTKKFI